MKQDFSSLGRALTSALIYVIALSGCSADSIKVGNEPYTEFIYDTIKLYPPHYFYSLSESARLDRLQKAYLVLSKRADLHHLKKGATCVAAGVEINDHAPVDDCSEYPNMIYASWRDLTGGANPTYRSMVFIGSDREPAVLVFLSRRRRVFAENREEVLERRQDEVCDGLRKVFGHESRFKFGEEPVHWQIHQDL